MNGSGLLAVVRFIIFTKHVTVSGAFAFYIYKTRSAYPTHLRAVWMKRATVSDVFHKNNETRH
jgi:hypothetical protein